MKILWFKSSTVGAFGSCYTKVANTGIVWVCLHFNDTEEYLQGEAIPTTTARSSRG